MARTTGPLLSQTASGGLGKQLFFRQTPNGTIVTLRAEPGAKPAPAPTGRTAAVRYLGTLWKQTAKTYAEGWQAAPGASQLGLWPTFLSHNLLRMARSQLPTATYPGSDRYIPKGLNNSNPARYRDRIAWYFSTPDPPYNGQLLIQMGIERPPDYTLDDFAWGFPNVDDNATAEWQLNVPSKFLFLYAIYASRDGDIHDEHDFPSNPNRIKGLGRAEQ